MKTDLSMALAQRELNNLKQLYRTSSEHIFSRPLIISSKEFCYELFRKQFKISWKHGFLVESHADTA